MCNWIGLCSWCVYISMYGVTLYYFLDQGEVVSILQRGTWRSFSLCHGCCKLVWNGHCMYRVLWHASEIILCWFSSSIAYGSSGFPLSLPGPKILNELQVLSWAHIICKYVILGSLREKFWANSNNYPYNRRTRRIKRSKNVICSLGPRNHSTHF